MARTRELSDRWTYDIDKNPIDQGEIWDGDVLNQSIELILVTNYGERLFNPTFGFGLLGRIFEVMSPTAADGLLDEMAEAIRRWEDRITLIESQMRIISNVDLHTISIIIPYIIKRSQIQSVFKKNLISNYS